MTIQEAINKVVDLAKSEVGYVPYSGKRTKYADYLDAIGDFYNGIKSGYDWCDVFVDYLLCKTFGNETGRNMLYQPKKSTGAGCGFSANFYRQNKAFTKIAQKGCQIFYGPEGYESHTGFVYDVDEKYVYTIEGNIGGGNGKVGKRKLLRTNSNIVGYGVPNWKLVANSKTEFTPAWVIDVSTWQGGFDFAKAKKQGVKGAIIRGGTGQLGIVVDNQFKNHYKNAKDAGMPIGCYWYLNCFTMAQVKKEAEFFYENCLKGKQYELPIYLDVENEMLKLSKRELTDIIKTFYNIIRNKGNGYWVGIYAQTSAFMYNMYDDELKSYAHWVAQYYSKCQYKGNIGMWQFTDGKYGNPKKVAGYEVDQNYMYVDYEPLIKARGLNGWSKNTPVTPTPEPKLDVDGVFGYNSVIALQKWMGTYQDGEISNQIKAQSVYFPALRAVTYGRGGSACIKALQGYLTKQGFNAGEVDGYLGKNTITALQKFLNKNGAKLTVDGYLGTNTAKALQSYLNKTVYK